MSDNELLPCPFCGSPARLYEWEFDAHDSMIECTVCDITGPAPNSPNETWRDFKTHARLREISNAEAIARWNRRASDPRLADLERERDDARALLKEAGDALGMMIDHYVDLVRSGDCGHWSVEQEEVVKTARATLNKIERQTP